MHNERFFAYVAASIVNVALLCVLFAGSGAAAVEGPAPAELGTRSAD